jgi:hypothetical protein
MKKTVLLDIDGVLIRDNILLNHVNNSVVSYVKTKIPKMHNSSKVNSFLYKTYGHTAIGLEKEYGVDTKDFNEKVYNIYVMDHLYNYLDTSKKFKTDATTIRHILDIGYNVELFSNSPLEWSNAVRIFIDPRLKTGVYEKPKIETYLKFDSKRDYIFVDDKLDNLRPVLFFDNWIPIHFSENVESPMVKTIHTIDEIIDI